MKIHVKFLASYSLLAGTKSVDIDMPEGQSVAELLALLDAKYPKAPINRDQTIVSVNSEVSKRDKVLIEGDRVNVFHLMAGG